METQSILEALPFWDHLTDGEKDAAARGATQHTYHKDDYILGASDACLGMVYLRKGSIRVYITSEEGREVTLFHITAGECCIFSSGCVIGGITLDVQMAAESEVELLALHAGTVASLMESNLHFKCFAYELSTARYSTVVWVILQILFSHFDQRLARLLLSIYKKTGEKTIRMTQEAMAQEVNSAREVVARMLRQFAADGWITLNRGTVVLQNIEALKNLVE